MTSSTHIIDHKASRRFRRLALNTLITLYLLIVAGGVVRSTGAGMGCPDWPKCFGRWVPPTEISELPHDYKQIYGAKLKGEIEFNPVKTWTEYVNRLLGAFTGLMIFATLLASIPYLKTNSKHIFYYSLAAFILVGFQGWLGAKVVSSELMPVVITLHMLLAIVIVFILLYLFTWSSYLKETFKDKVGTTVLSRIGVVVMICSLAQILLGTQVRENIDEIVHQLGYGSRETWIEQLGIGFYIHRSFSILILALNLFWVYKLKQVNKSEEMGTLVTTILVVLGFELMTGIIMAYFGVPAFAQPMHLTLGILLIGLQFIVWLLINRSRFLSNPEFRSVS